MLSVGNVQDESWEHSRNRVGIGTAQIRLVGGLVLDLTLSFRTSSLCISGRGVFSASANGKETS